MGRRRPAGKPGALRATTGTPPRRIDFEQRAMTPLSAPAPQHSSNLPVHEDWLAQWDEEILEPDLPIVDPHHHLWDLPAWRYLLEESFADVNSGHTVLARVF